MYLYICNYIYAVAVRYTHCLVGIGWCLESPKPHPKVRLGPDY